MAGRLHLHRRHRRLRQTASRSVPDSSSGSSIGGKRPAVATTLKLSPNNTTKARLKMAHQEAAASSCFQKDAHSHGTLPVTRRLPAWISERLSRDVLARTRGRGGGLPPASSEFGR